MKKWKKIPNYSLYECSNTGLIKTFNWKNSGKTRIMKPALDGSGYLRTMLKRDDGVIHTIKVHRIVAQTWIDNPENKEEVNHKNAIKTDNNVENLEWATRAENLAHSLENDLQYVLKGEEIGNSILTEKQVLEIRARFIPRRVTRDMLSQEYHVSPHTIKNVVTRRTWRHI